jgi:hypothetical protein
VYVSSAFFDPDTTNNLATAVTAIDVSRDQGYVRPEQFELRQNYPNPFSSTTSIEYLLPTAGHVRLTVMDLLGRPVREVVDGEQSAGAHRVEVDLSSLPSGVYLYRLDQAGRTLTARMVLLR